MGNAILILSDALVIMTLGLASLSGGLTLMLAPVVSYTRDYTAYRARSYRKLLQAFTSRKGTIRRIGIFYIRRMILNTRLALLVPRSFYLLFGGLFVATGMWCLLRGLFIIISQALWQH